MSATSPTKDWLKNQLVIHGVPLPASSAKKEEYQRLYDEQVAHQVKSSEFSSDDEAEGNGPTPKGNEMKNGAHDPDLDLLKDWIKGLDNPRLLDSLKYNGKDPGPIVDSTRDLYEKMLFDILKQKENFKPGMRKILDAIETETEVAERWRGNMSELKALIDVYEVFHEAEAQAFANGNGNNENGYSDTDEDDLMELETASRASRSSRASSKKRSTPVPRPAPVISPPTPARPASGIGLVQRSSAVTVGSSKITHITETKITAPSEPPSSLYTQNSRRGLFGQFGGTGTASGVSASAFGSSIQPSYRSSGAQGTVSRNATKDTGERTEGTGQTKRLSKIILPLLLFVAVIGVPMLAFYLYGYENHSASDPPEYGGDELEQLLDSMDKNHV